MFYVYGFYWAILKIKIMIFSSSYLGPFSKKSNPFIFLTHSSRHQPPPNDHLYHHGTKSSSSSTKSSSSSTSTETTAASISSSSPWRWIHSFVADLELFFLGRILVVKFGCLCSGGEKMIKKTGSDPDIRGYSYFFTDFRIPNIRGWRIRIRRLK
ncbi:transmembrane protein [Arabidopsis thaliana]|uniref:Transmembrane protein n=1 Tax=Arabidopsis thaliana TaxID=3702 RepID=F4HPN4_ARATH|nr:uncharacterized protein AT1G45163 [Arabidopsis thaliana]AEE32087.1 transmembrane protein [Arabidopsis thaliana]|eukprot:NP_001185156.1 transmembrane protein [Arabidopsis thaliana]